MAATIKERWDSGPSGGRDATGQGAADKVTLVVVGTDDKDEVHGLARAELPAFLGHLPYRSYRVEYQGGDVWFVEAEYGYGGKARRVTFTTAGGTAHMTRSLATTRKYELRGPAEADEAVPNFERAIGVNGDSIDGVDVGVATFEFTEEHWLPYSTVNSQAFLVAAHQLTYQVNDRPFRIFQTGEVLFLGCESSYEVPAVPEVDPDLLVPVTFRFGVSSNDFQVRVGDSAQYYYEPGEGGWGEPPPDLPPPEERYVDYVVKLGWEHLWILHDNKVDGEAKRVTPRPAYAYVEQVYKYGNFGLLGIGE